MFGHGWVADGVGVGVAAVVVALLDAGVLEPVAA
jgi:hypothetical protein